MRAAGYDKPSPNDGFSGNPEDPMWLAIALPINAVIRVLVMNDERHYDLIRDRERNEHEPRQDKHESVG